MLVDAIMIEMLHARVGLTSAHTQLCPSDKACTWLKPIIARAIAYTAPAVYQQKCMNEALLTGHVTFPLAIPF